MTTYQTGALPIFRGLTRRPAPVPSKDPGSHSLRSLWPDDDLRGMALAWPERGVQSRQQRCVNPAGSSPKVTMRLGDAASEIAAEHTTNDSLRSANSSASADRAGACATWRRWRCARPVIWRKIGRASCGERVWQYV